MFNPLARGEGRAPLPHPPPVRHGAVRFHRGDAAAHRPPFFLLSRRALRSSPWGAPRASWSPTSRDASPASRSPAGASPCSPSAARCLLLARRGVLLAPGRRRRATARSPGAHPVGQCAARAGRHRGRPRRSDVTGEYRLPSGHASRWRVEASPATGPSASACRSRRPPRGRAACHLRRAWRRGRYFVRVSALNEDGLAGPASEPHLRSRWRRRRSSPAALGGARPSRCPRASTARSTAMALARVSGTIALAPARPTRSAARRRPRRRPPPRSPSPQRRRDPSSTPSAST